MKVAISVQHSSLAVWIDDGHMITIPPFGYSVTSIVVHHSFDTSPSCITPHQPHHDTSSPYHASPTSRRQPHAASWFSATLITYQRPIQTFLKLLVLTPCRRYFEMLHRLWAPLDVPRKRRRGGWRQQLQTIETELEAEPARVSRLASGLLLEWADGSMSAAKLQQHCSHAGHCSECSQWVDELFGDVRHPAIDHGRGFR